MKSTVKSTRTEFCTASGTPAKSPHHPFLFPSPDASVGDSDDHVHAGVHVDDNPIYVGLHIDEDRPSPRLHARDNQR